MRMCQSNSGHRGRRIQRKSLFTFKTGIPTQEYRHVSNKGLLLKGLKSAEEGGATLLDRTMVLYGSNLGDANAHSTTNLPTLLAGGGFRHGQHLAFDPAKPPPLANLYVSMLQRLGIEAEKFGSSTGTLMGLETRG